jgi:hypothetical protein
VDGDKRAIDASPASCHLNNDREFRFYSDVPLSLRIRECVAIVVIILRLAGYARSVKTRERAGTGREPQRCGR